MTHEASFEPPLVASVLEEVKAERYRQHAKWGEQNHPNGTGAGVWLDHARSQRRMCEEAFRKGVGTWRHILSEEFAEALAEADPVRLRAELIQVAAVAVAWVEKIDRDATRSEAAPRSYPAGHGYTPATGPFATGEGCRVMLARYPCNHSRDQHDPSLPPVNVDVFGYRRGRLAACCPGSGTMAHVRGCINHPEADRG